MFYAYTVGILVGNGGLSRVLFLIYPQFHLIPIQMQQSLLRPTLDSFGELWIWRHCYIVV
jgi:hypothetical protein